MDISPVGSPLTVISHETFSAMNGRACVSSRSLGDEGTNTMWLTHQEIQSFALMPGAVVGSGSSKADYHAGAKPREKRPVDSGGEFCFCTRTCGEDKTIGW